MTAGQFLATLQFLVAVYWPFMLAALAIGAAAGWFSSSRKVG